MTEYKQLIYNNIQDAKNHYKYKVDTGNINKRYKEYNQGIFTAGDVDQFTSRLPYTNDEIMNTFYYLYHKFKKGIFVSIKDGKVNTFLPFSKKNYVNEWHHNLEFRNIKNVMNKQHKRYDWDSSHWYANNFIIRNEYPMKENDNGLPQLLNMLNHTCHDKQIHDCYFFINKRDFPLLTKNRTEPYNCIFGDDHPLVSHHYDNYAPILSMTSNNNFDDIPIPTWDDWTRIMSINYHKYFYKPCINHEEITNFNYDWASKKNVAVFRGSSTGNGICENTNIRIKLVNIKSDLLDVGITNWNNRPRLNKVGGRLLLSSFDNTNKKRGEWLTPKQQSNYKYIINISGHSSAFRLSLELGMMSVVLLVESDYKLWFQDGLEEYVHYVPIKRDLSDLLEKIEWCREHDDECEQIARNANKFYDKYLNEDGIYEYLENILNKLEMKEVNSIKIKNYTKHLSKYIREQPPIFEAVNISKNYSEVEQLTSDMTKLKINDLTIIRKKVKEHEALISLYGVNSIITDDDPGIGNFVYSYYYKKPYLYTKYNDGIQFQEWIIGPDFSIPNYLLYMKSITFIIHILQTSKYKFVHYDLSPWNIMIKENFDITFIDYEHSSCSMIINKNRKHYHKYPFSTIIDVLSILIKSLNTIFTCSKFKDVRYLDKEDVKKLLYISNFITGTRYRQDEFVNIYDLKRFVGNMSKYDNLLFMPRYELEEKSAEDFYEYILSIL